MAAYRCASIARLQEISHVSEDAARRIRAIWKSTNCDAAYAAAAPDVAERVQGILRSYYNGPTLRAYKRMLIDATIETHGVEYLGRHKRSGEHVDYCNAGDTYSPTIVFVGRELRVTTWGDMVEKGAIVESNNFA